MTLQEDGDHLGVLVQSLSLCYVSCCIKDRAQMNEAIVERWEMWRNFVSLSSKRR